MVRYIGTKAKVAMIIMNKIMSIGKDKQYT